MSDRILKRSDSQGFNIFKLSSYVLVHWGKVLRTLQDQAAQVKAPSFSWGWSVVVVHMLVYKMFKRQGFLVISYI